MSNRELKARLWQDVKGRCHWCGRETKLLNIPEIKGPAPADMATIDHLISRYSPERWVKRGNAKVLACYECNSKRANEETMSLSKEELKRRGQGFSLNPRGKPIFVEGMESLYAVLDKMKKHGIVPFEDDNARRNAKVCRQENDSCADSTS